MAEVNYYWRLLMRDGETIKVRPEHVKELKRQMREQKHLITVDWTRNVSDVKSFEKTSEPIQLALGSPQLAEEAAQAFREPIYSEVEYGGRKYQTIKARWVKRPVTMREWNTKFSKSAGYRLMPNNEEMAFVLPVHNIDSSKVTELTPQELRQLSLT